MQSGLFTKNVCMMFSFPYPSCVQSMTAYFFPYHSQLLSSQLLAQNLPLLFLSLYYMLAISGESLLPYLSVYTRGLQQGFTQNTEQLLVFFISRQSFHFQAYAASPSTLSLTPKERLKLLPQLPELIQFLISKILAL